jgi:hypothetical protein
MNNDKGDLIIQVKILPGIDAEAQMYFVGLSSSVSYLKKIFRLKVSKTKGSIDSGYLPV